MLTVYLRGGKRSLSFVVRLKRSEHEIRQRPPSRVQPSVASNATKDLWVAWKQSAFRGLPTEETADFQPQSIWASLRSTAVTVQHGKRTATPNLKAPSSGRAKKLLHCPKAKGWLLFKEAKHRQSSRFRSEADTR